MEYSKHLQALGFKKQEAEIYLACLKLGMAKVSELTREVDTPRTSIYVYLNNLINKGYLKKSKRRGVEHFIPVEPRIIQKEEEEKIKNFSKIVPQIEKLLDFPNRKPKVEYFDTQQGLFKLYESMLDYDYKHIPYLIESAEATKSALEKVGWDFCYRWEKKFLDKKIITQGIVTKSTIPILQNIPEKIKNVTSQRAATVKVINDDDFPFLINLYLLYPDRVFIIVPQENFIIIIQCKNIYKSLVTLYKLLYEKGEFLDIKKL